MMQLKQFVNGAPCGVAVEPLSHYELRLSCPNWLVDRSGFLSHQKLNVQYRGRPLPSCNGLTLLHAECVEESCTFLLTSSGQLQKRTPLEVRMPPNFSVVPWQTHLGDFVSRWQAVDFVVFCIQAEDLHTEDMHGAACQAMIFRPRLVLTNSSNATLQLQLQSGQIQNLEAQKSMVHHWTATSDDAQDFQLRFRPETTLGLKIKPPFVRSGATFEWSGRVLCGDETAGCTSFALSTGIDAAPRSKGKKESELWSVAVCPARGAMSVTFQRGSEFIAANRSTRMDLRMEIRPYGLEARWRFAMDLWLIDGLKPAWWLYQSSTITGWWFGLIWFNDD
ncbi:unnamed protein product [Cladocopium goreaui]|uniref:Vacuolar protein sorting-associated protein 13 VPS13 adaptor binding domain-containing protein n=1 Tax=Cladocopium goreaui TaxID=2562237 RepID=A0A9P1GH84_9DINO|nr:unnamed protein product [Cladocopium goreaui]